MNEIRDIAYACAKHAVDIPSYQYGNYSQGGVSGMIYHAEIRKLYNDAESAFDNLCEEMVESGICGYPRTIDDKVWAVIDGHHIEILEQMFADDNLVKCEDCEEYCWPNDYCGSCSKQIKAEET